jgi:sugar phosphate isomerase/epimerase
MKDFDHMQAVEDLAPFIVHTHAKDGKRGNGEVPLGEGDVDFPRYIEALRSHGYDGYFTVERECGDDPEADIRNAVDFLRNL